MGPAWIETEWYDIAANVPPDSTKEQLQVMLQNLLAERFHLTVRRETSDIPMYALVVGKNGPKFKQSDPAAVAEDEKTATELPAVRPKVPMGPDGFPQIPPDTKMPGSFTLSLSSGQFTRYKLFVRHQTIDQFADNLASHLNRPVKNLTGLAGQYDLTLAFESEPLAGVPRTAPSESAEPGPTIFSAVQEQLGLKLEQRKGPVEMLMVDRLDKIPTEN
jgi:uncharacterized protein (TIGR03435 family)